MFILNVASLSIVLTAAHMPTRLGAPESGISAACHNPNRLKRLGFANPGRGKDSIDPFVSNYKEEPNDSLSRSSGVGVRLQNANPNPKRSSQALAKNCPAHRTPALVDSTLLGELWIPVVLRFWLTVQNAAGLCPSSLRLCQHPSLAHKAVLGPAGSAVGLRCKAKNTSVLTQGMQRWLAMLQAVSKDPRPPCAKHR